MIKGGICHKKKWHLCIYVFTLIGLLSWTYAQSPADSTIQLPAHAQDMKAVAQDIKVVAQAYTVTIQGKSYTSGELHLYRDTANRLLVPLRFVSEALDAEIQWYGPEGILEVGRESDHLVFVKGSLKFIHNGKIKVAKAPMLMVNERGLHYVPLRFMGDYLGVKVEFQQFNETSAFNVNLSLVPEGPQGNGANYTINRGSSRLSDRTKEYLALLIPELPQVGTSLMTATQEFDKPLRVDMNALGQPVLVYFLNGHHVYLSHDGEKIRGLALFGQGWVYQRLKAGMTWSQVTSLYPFQTQFQVTQGAATISLKQVPENRGKRLLFMKEGTAYECFFDQDNDRLLGLRLMAVKDLVKTKVYPMTWRYSGSKPNFSLPVLSPNQRQSIALSASNQILDMTNDFRRINGLSELSLDARASKIALAHSTDMAQHNFVAHTSPKTGALKNRYRHLENTVVYLSENIAAGSFEGMDAVHSWINSPGHRENLVCKQVTSIGVGTFDKLYTQNFIKYK